MSEGAQNRRSDGTADMAVFPIYRKTTDDRHFYRIESMDRFTEVQMMGSRRFLHHVKAEKYPERLFIQEMMELEGGRFVPVDEQEWQDQYLACQR